jgi:hypothetical protein
MSNLYEVVLTHKEKLTIPAESASDAVAQAMKQAKDVAFEPSQWSVKEKEEGE